MFELCLMFDLYLIFDFRLRSVPFVKICEISELCLMFELCLMCVPFVKVCEMSELWLMLELCLMSELNRNEAPLGVDFEVSIPTFERKREAGIFPSDQDCKIAV